MPSLSECKGVNAVVGVVSDLVWASRERMGENVRELISSVAPGAIVYVPYSLTSDVVYESGHIACQIANNLSTFL